MAREALLQWQDLGFDNSLKRFIEIEVSFCNIQYKRPAMLQEVIIIKVNASDIKKNSFNILGVK